MFEAIRDRFFPMHLPSGVIGHLLDEKAARADIETIAYLIYPTGFKQAIGLYAVPPERRDQRKRMLAMHEVSSPMWVNFYDQRKPIGWFYGYMEDEESFFIDTIGLLRQYRNKGIYRTFLGQVMPFLAAVGIERLATTHHPNNRAVMIPELKMGFDIVGLEIHESHGAMVKMVCHLHQDRRRAFEHGFSMERSSE